MKKNLDDYLQNLPHERRKNVDDRAAEMLAGEMRLQEALKAQPVKIRQFEPDESD